MELDQLQAFLTLAKTKSFSRSAETLHVVQSAISARIKVLEEQVGKPLFIRDNRHVELTPAGEALIPFAERILALAEAGESKIRSLGVFEDKLAVGSTDSFWRHLLQPVLLDYCKRYPKTTVRTYTGHSFEVTQQLADGVLQVGILYLPPSLPGFRVNSLLEDDVVLIAHPKHPLSGEKAVGRSELSRIQLIYIPWDGELKEWIKSILPADHAPQLQLDLISMTVKFVGKNMGMAFVPRYTVARELKEGALIEVKLERDLKPPPIRVYSVVRKERKPRASVERWLQLLGEHGIGKP